MAKKPASVAKLPAPEPPAHLSDKSKALWREMVPRKAASPERLELLLVGLEARDRLEQVRLAIAGADLVAVTERTGAMHVNPLLKIEKEARQQMMQIWKQLRLNLDEGKYAPFSPHYPY